MRNNNDYLWNPRQLDVVQELFEQTQFFTASVLVLKLGDNIIFFDRYCAQHQNDLEKETNPNKLTLPVA